MKQTGYDPRNIDCGYEIPSENYSDQPYIVRTDDGAWLCVLTTGPGREGEPGQHTVTMRSRDYGKTWEDKVDVEPSAGPEASYAVLLKAPAGRIYCFYNHNTDNIREVRADDPPFPGGKWKRVDSLGHFVYKYSDDHGRSWSPCRYEIPIRTTEIDRENPYKGELKFFWNVGKPFIHNEAVYVPLHKIGRFGEGGFARSEGVLLKSPNLLTEENPEKVVWETLPDGEIGLRTPPGGGPVAEEQSFCVLSDGSFYCVYRSIDGHPVETYSRDGGHTWSPPNYMRYANGRLVKHPRAANFVWKCAHGKYLYWFHNHGGRDYEDRNPAWLCGGIEGEGPDGKILLWGQPEIVLYDDDPFIRMSYPDFVEEEGRYFLTETNKDIARVHEVDARLLEGLWSQFADPGAITREGLLWEQDFRTEEAAEGMRELPWPEGVRLPELVGRDYRYADYRMQDLRGGFSWELRLCMPAWEPGQILLDTRDESGAGVAFVTEKQHTIQIILNDGRTECRWRSDVGMLQPGRLEHIVCIVDGGPKIILFVINGVLCDGGEERQFGWGRYSPHLRTPPTSRIILHPGVATVRLYGRALRVSEAIGNFKANKER